jgi:mannose/cellobiose epimerase-like protein (N-acyl-D-glucosamine 2-epimerase family)
MRDTYPQLYNPAPAECQAAWDQQQRGMRYRDQPAQGMVERTANPCPAQTDFSSCQAMLRHLDTSYRHPVSIGSMVEEHAPAGPTPSTI